MAPSSSYRLEDFAPSHHEGSLSSSSDSVSDVPGPRTPLTSTAKAYPVKIWRRPVKWIRVHRSRICITLTILVIVQLLTLVILLGVNLAAARAAETRLRNLPSNNGVSRYLASLRDNKISRDEIFSNTTLLHVFLDEDFTRDIEPIPCHSHNDYQRSVPLYDALQAGCSSVEADIWIDPNDNATFLVGHKKSALSAARTLKNMYIDPIVSILDVMNSGNTSSPSGPFQTSPNTTLVLLLDFKMPADLLWPLIQTHLAPLREKGYLQYWNATTQTLNAGPVTIVASGLIDEQPQLIQSSETNPHHDIFLDAPLLSLSSAPNIPATYNISNSYYASSSLYPALGIKHFSPSLFTLAEDRDIFSTSQSTMLKQQATLAQSLGLKARYWNTPGWPVGVRNAIWGVLVEEVNVDVLNVDDVWGAARWDWDKCLVGWIGIC